MTFVIITGLSGAGKTEAMHCFEDMGYFCIDNLPPTLLPKMAELIRQSGQGVQRVAAVIDIRGGEFFGSVLQALEALQAMGVPYEILFLEANDDVLVRRYQASRRQHPLAPHGGILAGIAEERRALARLRERADRVIDTSRMQRGALHAVLREAYSRTEAAVPPRFTVVSFGYKHGLPLDADLVFDTRSLPNPHYVDALRDQTGLSPAVREFVLQAPTAMMYLEALYAFLEQALAIYRAEGRRQVTVAIGCTGGQHRSVVIAEAVAQRLRDRQASVQVVHRDLHLAATDAETGGPSSP